MYTLLGINIDDLDAGFIFATLTAAGPLAFPDLQDAYPSIRLEMLIRRLLGVLGEELGTMMPLEPLNGLRGVIGDENGHKVPSVRGPIQDGRAACLMFCIWIDLLLDDIDHDGSGEKAMALVEDVCLIEKDEDDLQESQENAPKFGKEYGLTWSLK